MSDQLSPQQEREHVEAAPVPVRTFPADLENTAEGDRGKGWSLLYELYGELPVPDGKAWKIAAMYLRAEQRAAKAEAENAQWRTWGIVEVAVRNPSVAEYVAHWEARATKAEQQVARLSAPVREIWFQQWKSIINAIGEISVQEAMDAIERGL